MRRTALFSALIAVVAIGLVIAATQSPASPKTTIKVYQKNAGAFSKSVNADDTASPVGDYTVSTAPLYRARTTTKVGRQVSELTIIRTLGTSDARFRVEATLRIGGGKLEVAGSSRFSAINNGTATLAVTGGTGVYSRASGTLVLRGSASRTHFTFNIRL